DHFALEFGSIYQRRARELIHPGNQLGTRLRGNEIGAAPQETFYRFGCALADAAKHELQAALGQIRILLRTGERELASDDAFVEQEPGMIVPLARDLFERAERVEAGKQRHRQPPSARI